MYRINKYLFHAFILTTILSFQTVNIYAQETLYHGFRCLNFKFEGHDSKIVFPGKAEAQRHWIWRALYRGHEPTNMLLLDSSEPEESKMAVNFRGNIDNCRIHKFVVND